MENKAKPKSEKKTFRGDEIMWESENSHVIITYNQFSLGMKYTVRIDRNGYYDFIYAAGTYGEALTYAKMIYDGK